MNHRLHISRFGMWITLSTSFVVLAALISIIAGCSTANMSTQKSSELTAQPASPLKQRLATGGTTGRGSRFGNAESAVTPLSTLVPPQSLPSAGEELWVIEKQAPAAPNAADEMLPRSGSLMAKLTPDAPPEQMQPCPLKHTDVHASIAGYIASVDVTQQFHNPFGQKIEAVYVFPLPANAAVNEFVMTIGDRRIRGIIREREQAKQIYENARQQGFVASLMTQERPNIFTQSVANIEPGKQIDIAIRYFHTLTYSDGWYEMAFPTVVGPRFNPPHMNDGVGAVGVGSRGASGQKTEVSYLKPGTRSGHDIAIRVDLDAGVNYEQVASVNHAINVQRQDERRAQITLNPADALPNKDFVLRWRVAGDKVKTGVIAARSETQGGHFAMMIVPPIELKNIPAKPMEFVFTLDVSGSMSGQPMEQSRAAMLYALRRLGPDDRFQVVKFAGDANQMVSQPVPATPENVDRAMRYVQKLNTGGGTMMLEGMRKSLDFPHDPQRTRVVCFLTDGYIGNEAEILGAMQQWLGNARVFSFGVGSSTNRYLLDSMAKVGRGAAAYVSVNENAEEPMAAFFERVRHPAMTDIAIDFGRMETREVFPRKPADLLVGRPIILTGKYDGELPKSVRISGRLMGETATLEAPVQVADAQTATALPPIWARSKIANLAEEATRRNDIDLPQQIKQVALQYNLMSSFTSFVAVDSSRRTEGNHGISTPVAVPVPDGVRYETTVTEAARPAAQRQ